MIKKVIGTIIFFLFVSSANAAEPTVSSDWLNKNLNSPNVFVLDIRNKLDGGGYDAFKEEHIPGSVHSDYLGAGWRTTIKGVVGQFPGTKALSQLIGGLEGVEKYKGYISYCNTGHWAATVWFGLSEIAQIPNVKMYDGGMTHWTYDPKRKVDLG